MIDWRRLTVITFHVAPRLEPIDQATITSGHHDDTPTTSDVAALEPRVIARQVPLPSRFDSHGARLLPIDATGGEAEAHDREHQRTDVRGSPGRRAPAPQPLSADARFIRPRMIAIERSRSWRHSQRKPSASSVFHGFCTWSSGRSARKLPGIDHTSTAATRKDAASTKNGSENAAISSSEPSGGPMNVLAMNSALHMRPLAFSNWSASTIDGMNVWPQLSRSTSAVPSSNVAINSMR